MSAKGHPPVTDEDRRRVADLHAQGLSRNAIATELGRSGRTISRVCAEHVPPLTFERRAALQVDALAGAQKLMTQMFQPTVVYNFGGKENDYNERPVDEPPFRDKRDIASAISALAATALKLAEYDKATGNEDEKSMLTDLREALMEARTGVGP